VRTGRGVRAEGGKQAILVMKKIKLIHITIFWENIYI
jgi:hypothetical protein